MTEETTQPLLAQAKSARPMPEMHIGMLLSRHARYRGDHVALVVGDRQLTFRELHAYVERLSSALLGAGLRKGDKFATVLSNGLELMAAYWAAARTGLVIVPGSPLLQRAGLATLLSDSDSVLVLADAAFAESLDAIAAELPALRRDRILLVGGGAEGAHGLRPFAEWLAAASGHELVVPDIDPSDPYNIMYSSGTTGTPKGIVHTHAIRAMYCMLFAQAWRMTPESVVLHSGSIVFNGSMIDLMPWMFVGCTYILHERFNPERVIEEIETRRVTQTVMVPSQIVAVLDSPAFDPRKLGSLQMLGNVGAPLLLEPKQRLNELLPGRFYELYGLTEGFVTILDKHDAMRKVGSVGCPPPFFEIRIVGAGGRPCPPGEIGEIVGRGPLLTPGYYKRPDLTAQAIVDGWLHTGDAGYLDDDGFLFLVDRIKDMLISGGVNVYPHDIEDIVIKHPAVQGVAVFGIPDPRWGEVPVAAVVLHGGASVTANDLIAWTNGRVAAKFQRLHSVQFVEDFPINVAGKTLKAELRRTYVAT
jgi:acyl-CoA synthetase (AMP-forming)/AMP-acid ligase II